MRMRMIVVRRRRINRVRSSIGGGRKFVTGEREKRKERFG